MSATTRQVRSPADPEVGARALRGCSPDVLDTAIAAAASEMSSGDAVPDVLAADASPVFMNRGAVALKLMRQAALYNSGRVQSLSVNVR